MAEILIYRAKDGHIELDVSLAHETLWLSQQQMADLFGTKRQAITKHLKNIFNSQELNEDSVCSILEHTATDGKKYKTKFYNLDAVISVGYRVNSSHATQFRIWATQVLKDHLIKDHPFSDGNKRIGCLIFLIYLKLQGIVIKINDSGLVALALLIAEGNPSQKNITIRLIVNLLVD